MRIYNARVVWSGALVAIKYRVGAYQNLNNGPGTKRKMIVLQTLAVSSIPNAPAGFSTFVRDRLCIPRIINSCFTTRNNNNFTSHRNRYVYIVIILFRSVSTRAHTVDIMQISNINRFLYNNCIILLRRRWSVILSRDAKTHLIPIIISMPSHAGGNSIRSSCLR